MDHRGVVLIASADSTVKLLDNGACMYGGILANSGKNISQSVTTLSNVSTYPIRIFNLRIYFDLISQATANHLPRKYTILSYLLAMLRITALNLLKMKEFLFI